MPTTEPIQIPIEGNADDFIADAKKVQSSMDALSAKLKEAGVSQSAYNKAVSASKAAQADQIASAKAASAALAAQAKSTQEQAKTATMSWTEFRSAYSVALDVVRVGQQVWRATGQEFVNYAEQVKNLSRNIGVTTEDASRLIQVADDVRISYESLGTAMKVAQKQGVDVSINGLEKLADKYKSLAPGVERTQFLIKTFGRSGLEMGKLLEQGGDGVRKMSGAIEDSLILTQDAIDKSDKYQMALDGLGDAWEGVAVNIGSKAVPALTSVLNFMNDSIAATKLMKEAGLDESEVTFQVAEEYRKKAAAAREATEAEKLANAAVSENTDATEDNADALNSQKEAVKAAEDALKDYKDQLDAVSQANKDAEGFIQSYADFQKGYEEDHRKAAADLQEAIKSGDKEAISEAQKGIQDLEATWHESTQKMIYDMVLAKVSVDGLTDAEFKATQDLAVQMGIRTQAQADEAKAAMDKANAIADGIAMQEDVVNEKANTDARLLELESAKAAAADGTTAAVVTGAAQQAQALEAVIARTDSATRSMIALGQAAKAAMGASGGTATAPSNAVVSQGGSGGGRKRDSGGPGIAGQAYMIGTGAQPEMFVPSTNGNFIPNADKKIGGTTYNINITNAKPESAENSIRSALKNLNYLGTAA